MKIKGIEYTDTINYKKICMTIMMPYCNGFKCGEEFCQNSSLAQSPIHDVDINNLIHAYLHNPLAEAVCFQGLEPMDSFDELIDFIKAFRKESDDDIVIYTGYTKEELEKKNYLTKLKKFGIILLENEERVGELIIKFGRFIPNQKPHYDDILGVNLASDNQYAERIR